MLERNPTTAGREIPVADLEPVPEADRGRYGREARRGRENHDPDEEI
jgi:hypothetical protein